MNRKIIAIDKILEDLLLECERQSRGLQRDLNQLNDRIVELTEMRSSISEEVTIVNEDVTMKLLNTLSKIEKDEMKDYKMPENFHADFYDTGYPRSKSI